MGTAVAILDAVLVGAGLWHSLRMVRIFLAAEGVMQPAFDAAADREQHEREGQRDQHDLPLPGAARNAETGGEEGAGRARENDRSRGR